MIKHARNIVAIVRKGHGLAEAPESTARVARTHRFNCQMRKGSVKHGLAWKSLVTLNFAIEWVAANPQLKKFVRCLFRCNFVNAVGQTMYKRACFMFAENGTNCLFMSGFAHVEPSEVSQILPVSRTRSGISPKNKLSAHISSTIISSWIGSKI